MKIIYQTQIPGKPPRETRIGGIIAAVVGILIFLGILALFLFLLPFAILGALAFVAFIILLLVAGWVYLGIKIGFRDLWDITRFLFGFSGGRMSWDERRKRAQKQWDDRSKGKPGVWS